MRKAPKHIDVRRTQDREARRREGVKSSIQTAASVVAMAASLATLVFQAIQSL